MSEVWTAEQYREYLAGEAKAKPHKYGAKAVVIDGHRFPSKLEGERYKVLKLRERAGDLTGLRLQPRFALFSKGEAVGDYVADFSYMERAGAGQVYVVEDAKGVATPVYKLKLKLFLSQYPHITFREIKPPSRRALRAPCRKSRKTLRSKPEI